MKRKINILLVIILILLVSCNVCFAAPSSADNSNWIRIIASIPDDIVFENNIVVEIKNEKTKEVKTYTLEDSEDYIGYYNIEPGTYKIKSAVVTGEYEGNFKCGYSKEKITIKSGKNEVFDIPLVVQFYVSNSQEKDIDKKFDGLTNEEVMDIVNENPPSISNDSGVTESDSYKNDVELSEKDSLDEHYKETAREAMSSDSLFSTLVSLGFTICLLVGLCYVFYILKSRNS